MKTVQKKVTQSFFNQVANEWFERTYDPKGNYLKFPVNRLRKDVALMEIEKLDLKPKMKTMDIGCGTGQLVIDLLHRGFEAYGIDIADKMIQEANKSLIGLKIKKSNKKIFKVADIDDLNIVEDHFHLVTALGLLEYLDTDEELFKVLKSLVVSKGYALVECRNVFFNLFSGNNYTVSTCNSGQFKSLVSSLSEVEKFSPVMDKGIPNIQKSVATSIEKFLQESIDKKEWNTAVQQKKYTKYPKKMLRRQHTPQELSKAAKEFGFELEYIVYYHLHPYPPQYEKKFPQIYNKISTLMTPLGQTSLGAISGSAFIGVLKKK